MLVDKEKDAERASKFCTENNLAFIVKSGSRCLEGFVGEKELETNCIKEKIEVWKEAVDSVSKLEPHAE